MKNRKRKKTRRADKVATIKYEKLPQAGNEMHNELDKSDNSNSNKKVWKSNMGQNMNWGRGTGGEHRTQDRGQGHCAGFSVSFVGRLSVGAVSCRQATD